MLRASAESVLFTSLYGGCSTTHSSSTAELTTPAVASVIDIDGVRILLDCGLDFNAPPQQVGWYLSQLAAQLPTIDCVLLSSPEALYCGALPFVIQHIRRGVPVVAPGPLCKTATHNVLGRFMARYANEAEFPVQGHAGITNYRMTNDDIFNAFRAVKEPYGNRTVLRRLNDHGAMASFRRRTSDEPAAAGGLISASDFEGIYEGEDAAQDADEQQREQEDQLSSIVAEPIGNYRIIGGYMWRLMYQTDDILYCPDYSLHPSSLLRRTAMPTRSTMVILGMPSGYAETKSSSSSASHRSLFDEHMPNLLRSVVDTFRREKDVLMPVTLSGRGLEMLMLFKQSLQEKGVTSYNIVMVHYQAKELLARLKTMTSLLLDNLVYDSNDVFAEVQTCKSLDELKKIPSPRLILADGLDLDDNIAPELLLSFLGSSGNLIIAVDTPTNGNAGDEGTNLQRLVRASKLNNFANSSFTWQYLRRAKLNTVELENFYLAQERAIELREQQQAERDAELRRTAVAYQEDMREGVTDVQNWDSDDDDATAPSNGGAGVKQLPAPDAAVALQLPRGLYLPENTAKALRHALSKQTTGSSCGIVFPQLDTFTSLATYLATPNPTNEDRGYGIPLTPAEISHLRRAAPHRTINDDAPLDLVLSVNDAQIDANIPCKVVWETASCPRVQANVFVLPWMLYEGTLDVATIKQLLLSQLAGTVKKIVPLGATTSDVRTLTAFCNEESSSFRAVASAQRANTKKDVVTADEQQKSQLVIQLVPNVPVQLAVAVFAFTVDLDPRFASHLQASLRPVRETRSAGYWEVGHVNGVLDSRSEFSSNNDSDSGSAARKRRRLEGLGTPVLTFPHATASNESDAGETEIETFDEVPLGSVYVGSLELPVIRDKLRQQLRQRVDVVRGLLTLEEAGACVRRSPSGDVTLSCVVGASMFEIREAIYAQYQHNL
ncbi:cleavage and polyadenylation specificity, putative [Bodo saltans]|uniref:Cleavage and polyadenylation specificity factor subunit 2 n=1 Tax=Bodo saltans TaxID=75058 RepID=A0A0S4JJR9_BODSA|nr:cleavage and polyadenylation specificity, putative [Bodo saltans]|eukprot:CUG89661.1 cleavage and polyadenylation specificity, putative [Bodo saltans]